MLMNAPGQGPDKFSHNTQLVSVQFVRTIRGQSADAVMNAVESGEFRFTWNVSTKLRAQIPTVRLWLPEILDPSSAANLTLSQAIAKILGQHREQWRGVEVAQMLMVSRPQIHRLVKTGTLRGKLREHTLWIQRPTLERFLRDRWQGSH